MSSISDGIDANLISKVNIHARLINTVSSDQHEMREMTIKEWK